MITETLRLLSNPSYLHANQQLLIKGLLRSLFCEEKHLVVCAENQGIANNVFSFESFHYISYKKRSVEIVKCSCMSYPFIIPCFLSTPLLLQLQRKIKYPKNIFKKEKGNVPRYFWGKTR